MVHFQVRMVGKKNLKTRTLFKTKIIGSIPSFIGFCTSLFDLNLSDNLLCGTTPSEVGLLQKLETWIIGCYRLSGLVLTNIANYQNLKQLLLDRNQNIVGSMSSNLGVL